MGQVVINEYSASNLSGYVDNYEKAEDWIELYNTGSSIVDLSGYYLSDDPDNPTKWQIPEGILISPYGFRLFWASGRNEVLGSNMHTNFKLKQTKNNPESVVFSDANGEIIDQFQLQINQLEHSWGRETNGSPNWRIFSSPTLNSSNYGMSYSQYSHSPEFDNLAGFYSGQVTVEMTNTEPNSTLYYTLDGTLPTAGSMVYTSPVTITSTAVLKAICISNSDTILPSRITFGTYFIDVEHNLPILSTSSNELEPLLNGNATLRPHGTIEYFEDGERIDFGYGEYNKHGQDSWAFPHRSFDYIARDEMGYHDAIDHPLLSLSDRPDYQRIIIRASGDDNYPGIDSSAHMRDFLIQTIADKHDLNVDLRRGERCVVYVNGAFWGVYSIREKVSDADYTNYYYNQDKYNIYYLMLWGGTWAEYGGDEAFADWNQLKNYILSNDMSNPVHYENVKSQYDVTSLVDYVLINSFVVCTDWINWNVGWWRGLNPTGGHQKWGYILWDEDATFNHYINYTNVPDETAYAEPCYQEGITSDPGKHIEILNKLLENEEFTQYYVARYQDLKNVAFEKDQMLAEVDKIRNDIASDMGHQINRWGGNFSQWEQNVQKVKDFITARSEVIPEGLNECYNLTGPYEMEVSLVPEGAGSIRFNSLIIDPENLPFLGDYHGGMPMKAEAIESNFAYAFDHWELNNHIINPSDEDVSISFSLTQNDHLTAVFVPNQSSDLDVVINEINYNPPAGFDTKDWVELHNRGENPVDISNWVFKDSDNSHLFVIPSDVQLLPDAYLVLAQDLEAFQALHPDVTSVMGDVGFGFSGGGELLRLYNDLEMLMDEVVYDDESPWPAEPDGNGPTLELINPFYDNLLAENWQASYPDVAPHGTPGVVNSSFVDRVEEYSGEFDELLIYPQPMQNVSQLFIKRDLHNGRFEIISLQGNVVFRGQISGMRTEISRNGISSGIYFIRVFENKRLIGTQKLIVN